MSRLDPRLLLQGYATGIFPMADSREAADLFWVEPRNRAILPLDRFHLSRSLRRTLRSGRFEVKHDQDFAAVVTACADREEEIARRVEALTPDAASLQRQILADNPGLEEVNRSLFAGRPLDEQLVVQASGERLGAATWRSFARGAPSAEVRETFLGCATLEEESAAYLESMIGSRARPETHVSGRSQTRA